MQMMHHAELTTGSFKLAPLMAQKLPYFMIITPSDVNF